MSRKPRSQTNRSGSSLSRNCPKTRIPAASCGSTKFRSKRSINVSRFPGCNLYWPSSMTALVSALARDLGVSRLVVLIAYEELAAGGYLVGRRGSGSWVVEQVADRPVQQRAVSEKPRRRGFLSAYAQRARRLGPHAFPPRKSGAD